MLKTLDSIVICHIASFCVKEIISLMTSCVYLHNAINPHIHNILLNNVSRYIILLYP